MTETLNRVTDAMRNAAWPIGTSGGFVAICKNQAEFLAKVAIEAIGESVTQGEIRVIAEGSPKKDCPLCGSSDLDCEDDAPAFHVHCNGCGTHFDNQDSFAFFDRRPKRESSEDLRNEYLRGYQDSKKNLVNRAAEAQPDRLARAMYEDAYIRQPERPYKTWAAATDYARDEWIAVAKAAIAYIRGQG